MRCWESATLAPLGLLTPLTPWDLYNLLWAEEAFTPASAHQRTAIRTAGQSLKSLGCAFSSPENLQLHGCYCFSWSHATSSQWGQLSVLSTPAERKQTNKNPMAKPN